MLAHLTVTVVRSGYTGGGTLAVPYMSSRGGPENDDLPSAWKIQVLLPRS